jgi:DNA primase
MDSDDAGNIAAKKIIEKITELDMNAFQVVLPAGMDPDDFANNYDLNFLDKAIQDMIESNKKKLIIKG